MKAHQLLAKTNPPKPLWQHMADVGCVARALLCGGFGGFLKKAVMWTGWSREDVTALICYMAAMHDAGKAHPLFQACSPEMERLMKADGLNEITVGGVHFRHEKYSAVLLKRALEQRLGSKRMARYLPAICGLHHQGKSGEQRPIYCNPLPWEEMQSELEQEMYGLFSFSSALSLEECQNVDALCTIMLGVVILSDWVASGELQEPLDTDSPEVYAAYANREARLALERCGLSETGALPVKNDYREYWPWLSEPRPIQNAIKAILAKGACPGLTIIEAPMGEGKSEAALYLALALAAGTRGLYFALPTSATSNQMYTRTQALFTRMAGGSVRLLHSTAWLADQTEGGLSQEDGEDMSAWLMPLRRGLLSHDAVGTVDQAMLSVMNVKYGESA